MYLTIAIAVIAILVITLVYYTYKQEAPFSSLMAEEEKLSPVGISSGKLAAKYLTNGVPTEVLPDEEQYLANESQLSIANNRALQSGRAFLNSGSGDRLMSSYYSST